jgi:hypothetical protein
MAQGLKGFDRQVAEVLESFDFDQAHKIMQYLNWKWAIPDRISTRGELVAEADRLLRELEGNQGCTAAVGSARATRKTAS